MGLVGNAADLVPPRAITGGSCPRVLVEDETGAQRLAASVVAGALYPWAERRDVVPLPSLRATDGDYRLRIENDSEGTTDLVRSVALIVVEHEEEAEIVATPGGALVAVRDARAALRTTHDRKDGHETWIASFATPPTRDQGALLVLRARSTAFAEAAFFGYVARMGQGVDLLMEHAVRTHCGTTCASEVMDDELARLGLPLQLTIGDLVTTIAPLSPATPRTFAVPIALPPDGAPLTFRFDATAGFWELEEVRLASPSEEIASRSLAPRVATRVAPGAAEDVTARLGDDAPVRLLRGDHLDVRFSAPPDMPERHRTAFVAVRAHYRVPIGGGIVHPAAIVAHRLGLMSLPRYAAATGGGGAGSGR